MGGMSEGFWRELGGWEGWEGAARLAYTPAKRSKGATQLSPKAALPALCLIHDTWQIFTNKIGSLQDFYYICESLEHFWFAIHDQMA